MASGANREPTPGPVFDEASSGTARGDAEYRRWAPGRRIAKNGPPVRVARKRKGLIRRMMNAEPRNSARPTAYRSLAREHSGLLGTYACTHQGARNTSTSRHQQGVGPLFGPAATRNGTLADELAGLTRPGELCEPGADGVVRCVACAHQCRIPEGGSGVCLLRSNRGGILRVPWGYVSGVACDPVEKKPFFHLLPGGEALSFGMLGCNFRCAFCQNWETSQVLRDPEATATRQVVTPEMVVDWGRRQGAQIIASTYNEPLITSEWGRDIFALGREAGMLTCYVSNGFASPQVIDWLDPWLDAMNVDLKCFTDEGYRQLGGRLEPVCDTIRALSGRGKWLEVITLIVPGFNDGEKELSSLAEFLVSVSPDIPWHVSAYHAAYRMSAGPRRTSTDALRKALEIGRSAGVRYVYAGNVRAMDGSRHECTYCHSCGHTLVERQGFRLLRNDLRDGRCPVCGVRIPGIWSRNKEQQDD